MTYSEALPRHPQRTPLNSEQNITNLLRDIQTSISQIQRKMDELETRIKKIENSQTPLTEKEINKDHLTVMEEDTAPHLSSTTITHQPHPQEGMDIREQHYLINDKIKKMSSTLKEFMEIMNTNLDTENSPSSYNQYQ